MPPIQSTRLTAIRLARRARLVVIRMAVRTREARPAKLESNGRRPFDWRESRRYAAFWELSPVTITLNGEPYQLEQPLSVTDLLARLEIDPRRVAVEHNLTIIKRHTYTTVVIGEGDTLEIVNAVGGG
jgi:sulfur carrier protein